MIALQIRNPEGVFYTYGSKRKKFCTLIRVAETAISYSLKICFILW